MKESGHWNGFMHISNGIRFCFVLCASSDKIKLLDADLEILETHLLT